MTPKETKALCYRLLAEERFAKRPDNIPPRQWAGVKGAMNHKFFNEIMKTPMDLYTSEQVWHQLFKKYLV